MHSIACLGREHVAISKCPLTKNTLERDISLVGDEKEGRKKNPPNRVKMCPPLYSRGKFKTFSPSSELWPASLALCLPL